MPEESGRWTDDGWLRTGDVATIDADGYIRIVDRAKDLIKSGGEWISPERNARRTGRGLSGGHELSRCGVMWPPTGLRRAHHEDTKITKTPEEDLPRSHRETEPPTRRTPPRSGGLARQKREKHKRVASSRLRFSRFSRASQSASGAGRRATRCPVSVRSESPCLCASVANPWTRLQRAGECVGISSPLWNPTGRSTRCRRRSTRGRLC